MTFGHEFWNTTLSIMQGVHLAATRATSEGNRPLSSHDFYVRDKYILKPESNNAEFKGNRSNADLKDPIKFYDFAPRAFHVLRLRGTSLRGITSHHVVRVRSEQSHHRFLDCDIQNAIRG